MQRIVRNSSIILAFSKHANIKNNLHEPLVKSQIADRYTLVEQSNILLKQSGLLRLF